MKEIILFFIWSRKIIRWSIGDYVILWAAGEICFIKNLWVEVKSEIFQGREANLLIYTLKISHRPLPLKIRDRAVKRDFVEERNDQVCCDIYFTAVERSKDVLTEIYCWWNRAYINVFLDNDCYNYRWWKRSKIIERKGK